MAMPILPVGPFSRQITSHYRRGLLGLLTLCVASKRALADDEHLGLEGELGLLRARFDALDDDDEAEVVLQQIDKIESRIAFEPATTPRGCAVQVRLALYEWERGATLSDHAVIALRQAETSLDRMEARQ